MANWDSYATKTTPEDADTLMIKDKSELSCCDAATERRTQTMSNETIKEIIKSYAYGYTTEKVAEVYEITESEVAKIKEEHAAEIKEKADYLKEQGWM